MEKTSVLMTGSYKSLSGSATDVDSGLIDYASLKVDENFCNVEGLKMDTKIIVYINLVV